MPCVWDGVSASRDEFIELDPQGRAGLSIYHEWKVGWGVPTNKNLVEPRATRRGNQRVDFQAF